MAEPAAIGAELKPNYFDLGLRNIAQTDISLFNTLPPLLHKN